MSNYWIFQANPNTYDIDGLLKAISTHTLWRAKQRYQDMRKGDWPAAGFADGCLS